MVQYSKCAQSCLLNLSRPSFGTRLKGIETQGLAFFQVREAHKAWEALKAWEVLKAWGDTPVGSKAKVCTVGSLLTVDG